ncbi:ABC transporter permease [Vallitalea okinawensis]|uniref:ABC transporter permease n=1 Tax=Vallitalea okinawensis TaxID=2078660 RepID=UPI000CFC8111
MCNLLLCEFQKLKRTYLYLIIAVSSCSGPLILALAFMISGKSVTWNQFMKVSHMITIIFINIFLVSLIIAWVFGREYLLRQEAVLYTYPIIPINILIIKVIVISIIMIAVYTIQSLTTILCGLLVVNQVPPIDSIIINMSVYVYSMLFHFITLPIPIMICLWSKSMIMPLVYGGLITISNLPILALDLSIQFYIPTFYSLIPLTLNNVLGNTVTFPYSSRVICILTFFCGAVLCIYKYTKKDI